MYFQLQLKTFPSITVVVWCEVKSPLFMQKLTLHCDLDGAVFLPNVIAGCAPVDASAVHGEIPQGNYLWIFEI